jgi:hypothetical protein
VTGGREGELRGRRGRGEVRQGEGMRRFGKGLRVNKFPQSTPAFHASKTGNGMTA